MLFASLSIKVKKITYISACFIGLSFFLLNINGITTMLFLEVVPKELLSNDFSQKVLYYHTMPTTPIWPCVNFGLVYTCEGAGVKNIVLVLNSDITIKPPLVV